MREHAHVLRQSDRQSSRWSSTRNVLTPEHRLVALGGGPPRLQRRRAIPADTPDRCCVLSVSTANCRIKTSLLVKQTCKAVRTSRTRQYISKAPATLSSTGGPWELYSPGTMLILGYLAKITLKSERISVLQWMCGNATHPAATRLELYVVQADCSDQYKALYTYITGDAP